MGTYIGNNGAWIEQVYQFDETDVVQGGPDGIDNEPLKNLADRTAWLKAQLGLVDRLNGDVVITANTPLTEVDHAGKLIIAAANGVLTLTLDDVANFKAGTIIPISSFCTNNSVVNVQAFGTQKFYDNGAGRSIMYMHNKEHLFLVASAGGWKILNAIGNFYNAGEELKCRKILNNTLSLVGALISRTLFPRLFEYVSGLPAECIVTEAVWLSDPVRYRGFYTLGDGATNFRIPDERGLSERTLDQGRALDLYRMDNKPGGYEKDGIVDHHHDVDPNPNANSNSGWGKITTGNDGPEGTLPVLKSSGPKDSSGKLIGQSETTVKTLGKYSLVRF